MTSIVITYHNEGFEFLNECLTQMKNTIDISDYEIIVVDDCSDKELPLIEGVKIIRNDINVGDGQSFDMGVSHAQGENIFLICCDIRFGDNNWASKLLLEVESNPRSFICTCCIGMNTESRCCGTNIVNGLCANTKCKNYNNPALDNMDFEYRRTRSKNYGANMLLFWDAQSDPKKDPSFRGVFEAKWKRLNKESPDKSYELPCVLGACYGVKKEWYQYIDGAWGHRQWGTMDGYLSFKSWFFGGSCLIAPHIETGHIFRKHSIHPLKQENIMYNKILIANLLFEDGQRYIDFLGSNSVLDRAKALVETNKEAIQQKRKEYKQKITLSIEDFCDKFDIDIRKY